MKTITVNVDEKVAHRFRQRVASVYGKRKGVLSKAVAEAMEDWNTRHETTETFLRLLEQGHHFGKKLYSNRDELHDRT